MVAKNEFDIDLNDLIEEIRRSPTLQDKYELMKIEKSDTARILELELDEATNEAMLEITTDFTRFGFSKSPTADLRKSAVDTAPAVIAVRRKIIMNKRELDTVKSALDVLSTKQGSLKLITQLEINSYFKYQDPAEGVPKAVLENAIKNRRGE